MLRESITQKGMYQGGFVEAHEEVSMPWKRDIHRAAAHIPEGPRRSRLFAEFGSFFRAWHHQSFFSIDSDLFIVADCVPPS